MLVSKAAMVWWNVGTVRVWERSGGGIVDFMRFVGGVEM